MRKSGKSLGYICRNLGLSKTTAYHHIRKHFGRSIKLIEIDTKSIEGIGEILGAFASDGSAVKNGYQIRFYYGENEKEYVKSFASLLQATVGKKPRI